MRSRQARCTRAPKCDVYGLYGEPLRGVAPCYEEVQRGADAGEFAGEPLSLFAPEYPELLDEPVEPDIPDELLSLPRPAGLSHALKASVITAADKTIRSFIKTFCWFGGAPKSIKMSGFLKF